jgi:hypothetical protein
MKKSLSACRTFYGSGNKLILVFTENHETRIKKVFMGILAAIFYKQVVLSSDYKCYTNRLVYLGKRGHQIFEEAKLAGAIDNNFFWIMLSSLTLKQKWFSLLE